MVITQTGGYRRPLWTGCDDDLCVVVSSSFNRYNKLTDQDAWRHTICWGSETNPAVWTSVIPVRHQKSFFRRSETKPPRRTTVVQVRTRKPNPLTPIIRYPIKMAYPLMITTSFHSESSMAYWRAMWITLRSPARVDVGCNSARPYKYICVGRLA